MLATILDLVDARSGHFRFESGHHGDRWLELDPLFARPARVRPVTDALARLLAPHDVQAVCGPLVGGAFVAQLVAAELGAEALYAERETPAARDALYSVRYRLPRALRRRARGRRVAVVDDVVSAGSSVRATVADLRACGAEPVVVGGLLVMGGAAAAFFEPQGVPVLAVARTDIAMWEPRACPLCAAGAPLDDVLADAAAGRDAGGLTPAP